MLIPSPTPHFWVVSSGPNLTSHGIRQEAGMVGRNTCVNKDAVIRSYIAEKVIKSLGWNSTTLISQKWVWFNPAILGGLLF